MLFAVPNRQVPTGLNYERPVVCFSFQLVYAAFVVVLICEVNFRFCHLLHCVLLLKVICISVCLKMLVMFLPFEL